MTFTYDPDTDVLTITFNEPAPSSELSTIDVFPGVQIEHFIPTQAIPKGFKAKPGWKGNPLTIHYLCRIIIHDAKLATKGHPLVDLVSANTELQTVKRDVRKFAHEHRMELGHLYSELLSLAPGGIADMPGHDSDVNLSRNKPLTPLHISE